MNFVMNEKDRWRVSWRRQKKVNGFTSNQEVIVYGIENVEHVIKTIVPTDVKKHQLDEVSTYLEKGASSMKTCWWLEPFV